MIKLHQRIQTTFIYVTHDQIEAMTMGSRIAVLRDGVLQQLDTPHKLYQHPANMFVAGFIGSPAMNFFDVGVAISEEQASLNGDGFGITLSGERARALAPYQGKRVVMGVRPEHLSGISQGETDDDGALPALVEVVESMGSEQHLYLVMGSKSFVAKMDGTARIRIGDQVRLAFKKELVHLFDKESQRSLLPLTQPDLILA